MSTKVLMMVSALVMGFVGLLFSFFPQELLDYIQLKDASILLITNTGVTLL